jgi:uncharacterized protein YjbJ (UPF0337 family)
MGSQLKTRRVMAARPRTFGWRVSREREPGRPEVAPSASMGEGVLAWPRLRSFTAVNADSCTGYIEALSGGMSHMAAENKAANKVTEVKGKVKEGVGKATDDQDLEAEGKTDQAKGNLKQASEKVKDAFKK